MFSLALLALSLFAPVQTVDVAPTPVVVEVAPMPRAVCPTRGTSDCLCPDGDLRCRARAALSLAAAAKTVPVAMPSKEAIAARAALKAAETKVKAGKKD